MIKSFRGIEQDQLLFTAVIEPISSVIRRTVDHRLDDEIGTHIGGLLVVPYHWDYWRDFQSWMTCVILPKNSWFGFLFSLGRKVSSILGLSVIHFRRKYVVPVVFTSLNPSAHTSCIPGKCFSPYCWFWDRQGVHLFPV